jgi:hypothetical protein
MTQGVFDRSTAERNAAIIRHWKFGLTQTGIGRLMDISRSIVAGVLTRAREDGLIGRLELEDAAARRKAIWANGAEQRTRLRQGYGGQTDGLARRGPKGGGGHALAEVGAWQCRYPYGDPDKPGFRFCRHPRHGDGPYCLHHAQVCYQGGAAAE